MKSLVSSFAVWFILTFKPVTLEYCYYREDKGGKDNYLECELFEMDQSIEGISLIHLKHNTTISVIEKRLLSPFKNLKTLYITAANVERIEPGALQNYKLEMIDLYHNNLRAIENGTFSTQNVLEILDMSYNKFELLVPGMFSDLVSLKWLSLVSNKIKIVDKAAFRGLTSLKALFLRFNAIEAFDSETFNNLQYLELLDLSFNYLIKIQFGLFSRQSSLKKLDMEYNFLSSFADHVFDNLSSLVYLDVSHNKIIELQDNLFYHTKELEILKFTSNNIFEFNVTSLLAYAPKLHEVYLYDNQWNCDYLKKMLVNLEENYVYIAQSTPVLASAVRGIGCKIL